MSDTATPRPILHNEPGCVCSSFGASECPCLIPTPRPWSVGLYDASLDFVKIGVHVAVCKPDLSLIATCGPAGDKQSEADAALIVRAVNRDHLFDDLLLAVRYLVSAYAELTGYNDDPNNPMVECYGETVKEYKKLIAKAEALK